MEADNEGGNKYAFKLGGLKKLKLVCEFIFMLVTVFEDSDVTYFFIANFAKDQDEWMRLLNMAG